ncbi:hypothetical protein PMF13cell1_04477 [Blautia producta]|uniref:Uncharacterized protein n=2 Tax=Blautia producta TaxID=33035 RepID=A0A4V0Z834_9FIRM|nr:hypothetical protein PMF13cell1_04477 [Blautia producta]
MLIFICAGATKEVRIMRYRKKPVDIEAFRLTDDPDRIAPEWFTRAVEDGKVCIDRSLLDGHMHVYGCTIMTPGESGLKEVIHISPFETQGDASYFYAQTRYGLKRCVAGDTDDNGW